jgi:NDP-sugar pyrophosphorylase family protein
MDAAQVREIGQLPEVRQMRQERFDIGGDLLPWLVKRGYSVYGFPIEAAGDLGSFPAYLATMRRALSGGFNSLNRLMGEPFDRDRLIWIDQETLATKDSMGRSLLARIRRGEVRIKGKVRIGRFVTLGSGVNLEESNLDDECQVESDVGITGCSLGEGTMVGQGATLSEVVTGLMVQIDSSPEEPTRLEGMVALGDEVIVEKGVQVRGPLCAHPKVVIPQGCDVPLKAEMTTSAEAAERLRLRESLRAGRQTTY